MRKIPEEIKLYFDQRYSELKQDAETYGDLKRAIKKETSKEGYADASWGSLLHTQLMNRLSAEVDCLPIVSGEMQEKVYISPQGKVSELAGRR